MQRILILDFGSQFTQLIARRVRELGVYTEILPANAPFSEIQAMQPKGLILSGGPHSVFDSGSPQADPKVLSLDVPVLGICYGMQWLGHALGGKVEPASTREYGFMPVHVEKGAKLFAKMPTEMRTWMSHGDIVEKAANGCQVVALSESGHPAAMKGERILAVQFHPEVAHTDKGEEILKYFTAGMCGVAPTWKAPQIVEQLQEKIQKQVGSTDHVLVGLSGGVDSSVVATLLTKTLKKRKLLALVGIESAAVYILWHSQVGQTVLYPIFLVSTIFHELGHSFMVRVSEWRPWRLGAES